MPEETQELTPEQIRDQQIGRLVGTLNFFNNALPLKPFTLSPSRDINFNEISSYEKVPEMETIQDGKKTIEAEVIDPETLNPVMLHELHMKNGDIILLDDHVNPEFPDVPCELDMFMPVWIALIEITQVHWFRTIMELAALIPEEAPPEAEAQDMGDAGN